VNSKLSPLNDWTVKDGRANSSDRFNELAERVGEIIRNSAHDLIAGRSDMVGHLVMAQLAHVHGLVPRDTCE
jgi:hypothetical protein